MAKGKDSNYVSFWFWFFAMLVVAIPCIGLVMTIVWAFVGENESRKNYFKAILAWTLIGLAIWAALVLTGLSAGLVLHLEKVFQTQTQHPVK